MRIISQSQQHMCLYIFCVYSLIFFLILKLFFSLLLTQCYNALYFHKGKNPAQTANRIVVSYADDTIGNKHYFQHNYISTYITY